MTTKFSVKIEAEELIKSLQRFSEKTESNLVDGLNEAAFQLRSKWLLAIKMQIDKPTAFTKNPGSVLVDKATLKNAESTVKVGEVQSQYLSFIVEGLTRHGRGPGSVKGDILQPARAKLNRFGNFPESPSRWVGAIRENIKGGFVGSPGTSSRRAVYQRMKNDRVKLLAVFRSSFKYEKTLPLFDIAQNYADEALTILNRKIERLLQ